MDNETTIQSSSNGISTSKAETNEPFTILSNTLCGKHNPTFYDQAQSWDTFDPDVSSCFRKTVLTWIPCAFFWLFLPIRIKQIMKRKGQAGTVISRGSGLLNLSKTVAACFLVIIGIIDLALVIVGIGNPEGIIILADVLDALLRILTFSAIIGLTQQEKINGFMTSWHQFFFWLLFLATGIIGIYSNIRGFNNGVVPVELLVTFMCTMIGSAVSFVLHFWAEPEQKLVAPELALGNVGEEESKDCPKLSASLPSELAFSWFDKFAWTGFKRALTKDDLWDLPPELSSKTIVPKFENYWDPAVQSILKYNASLPQETQIITNEADDVSVADTSNLLRVNPSKSNSGMSTTTNKSKRKTAHILPSLVRSFGPRFLLGSLLKIAHDLLIFISPFILKRIIRFAQGKEELWKGVLYACILLITTTIQTLALGRYFYDMYAVGIKIKAALISSIYRKSLRVSQSGKNETTTGEVVNLMSVDVQRIVDLMPYFNMLWSAPLQILLCLIFLWQILGPSVLAGLLVMILLIPVNGLIAVKSKALQVKQMKEKDLRVKIMNEILQGIKIIKLYAWEGSFESIVLDIRNKEIKILTTMGYLNAITMFAWACAPFLVSLATFATYVLISPENILDAEKAFVALALFNIMRFPLAMIPMLMSSMIQACVSVKRIDKYMNSSELNEHVVTKLNSSERNDDPDDQNDEQPAIRLDNSSFRWSSDDQKICLQNISLEIPKRSLVAIVGQVGSGKSSLLSAMLGEMEPVASEENKIQGIAKNETVTNSSVIVDGSLAYAAQQAWIQNASLKNNILFNKPLNETKYKLVVDACALQPDLEVLSAGDETEIGEKGINLSGGQKQRVALARASYSNADIFLLDDPLSAVDSHVGKHIFEKVIGSDGILSGTTRVLVTHSLTYLPYTDKIIVMKNGKISQTGTYQDLLEKKGDFADLLTHYTSQARNTERIGTPVGSEVEIRKDLDATIGGKSSDSQIEGSKLRESCEIRNSMSRVSSANNAIEISSENLSGGTSREADPKKSMNSHASTSLDTKNIGKTRESIKSKEKILVKGQIKSSNTQYETEKVETGKVSIYVYLYYLKSMGYHLAAACVFLYLVNQVFSAASNIWLSIWSDAMSKEESNYNTTHSDLAKKRDLHLGVYGGLGLGQAVSVILASVFLYMSTLTGAKKLHHIMLGNVLRSPMSFFDTTPQGRILNRFGKDVDVLDSTMPMIMRGWITCLLGACSTFLIILYTTPIFIIPIAIILAGYYLVQKLYVATSRQLKRLESVSRSPIYSHFGETINGAITIRAYGLQNHFIRLSELTVDDNQKANFPSVVSNRWLAVRLETAGNLIIFAAALLAVLGRDTLTPGLVGLSLSYALSVTQTLNWLVRMSSEVETNIVAVERLKEYSETKTEAEWKIPETKPEPDWPSLGKINVQGYSTRYRDNLDLVLKNVSFEVEGGKKVGIVGRTGAGKSSFTLALFRIIEATEGEIQVDGINIATLGLHELRSKITIIPQDPVLFSGSLRMNLDPFDAYTDEKIWEALKLAHLETFVSSLNEGLLYTVAEGGDNLSVGQRQLICLARALLRKTKILVLDEATAAVDLETDDLIQATIRKEFSDCTIMTIAHRLSTIMDYDMILVLQNGEKVEYDSPEILKKNSNSIFYSMCTDAGLVK